MSVNNIYLTFYYVLLIALLVLCLCIPSLGENLKLPIKGPVLPYFFARIPTPDHNPFSNNRLKAGLKALGDKQLAKAIALRNSIPKNSFNRNTLTWAIAISAIEGIPSSELEKALKELKNWPGEFLIRCNFERALANEKHAPERIIDYFAITHPNTADGMAILGEALIQSGQKVQARAIIIPWWYTARLNEREEKLIIKKVGPALRKGDYQARLKAMLYAYRFNSAEMLVRYAKASSLYKAFIAVAHKHNDAAKKLAVVNASWKKDPIYIFAFIQYLRHAGKYEQAAKLMFTSPKDPAFLVDPDTWWIERRILSREILDLGNPQMAYQLAANHAAKSLVLANDAEFHAGWYALRFLKNPQLAKKHFALIKHITSLPSSTSRSFYWLGRTAEVLHEKEKANSYFLQAAHYNTSFYGQLAASYLKRRKLKIIYPHPTTEDRKRFANRQSVRALKYFEINGYKKEALCLYHALAEKLESPGELALLAVMAEHNNDYHTSLKIGKNAVHRGLSVGSLSHPIGAIPISTNIPTNKKALAYAIARQESEFNTSAISNADARGILQLLPKTAKAIAMQRGMDYSIRRLTNDPTYNIILGAHFLDKQLERFKGSYILTLVSYNAGSRRAAEWITRYGDPRGRSVDEVVDWVERIPFTETRNYVQRVMENYEVYKMRFKGVNDIKDDLIANQQ
ncbi:MAG: soluble lytic murein transglycosylase [Candidatus Tokpelaia sp. JSC188]|nr:MAG: soluble lytic murein transglycosylase [Candidatus Tokpelaia sp. JSC188]